MGLKRVTVHFSAWFQDFMRASRSKTSVPFGYGASSPPLAAADDVTVFLEHDILHFSKSRAGVATFAPTATCKGTHWHREESDCTHLEPQMRERLCETGLFLADRANRTLATREADPCASSLRATW